MLTYFTIKEFLICSVIMLILIITCIDLLIKIKFGRRHARNTPVTPYIPLIGSTYCFLKKNPLTLLGDICKDYKSFYIWVFTEPYYVTCDPDDLQIILTHDYSIEKGSAYNVLKSVLHEAIILSPAAVWRKTRRTISKVFKYNVFITFIPSFNELTDEYIQTIETEENTADLENKFTEFFVDTFFHNFMKFDTTEEMNKFRSEINAHKASKLIMDSVICRLMNPLCYFDCIYKLTSVGDEYFKTNERLENFFTEFFQDYNQYILLNFAKDEAIHSRRKKRKDLAYSEEIDGLSLIDVMDESGTDFQNILADLSFISGAAGETSGIVLTYAMAVLGLYKDIQADVHHENVSTFRVIEETQVISTTSAYYPRLFREGIEIQKHHNNFNRTEEGLQLNKAWLPALKNSAYPHDNGMNDLIMSPNTMDQSEEKVYEEVTGVIGHDGMIDSMALHHLKYTKMVLFETMRMFTPLPMILRQVTEDLDLKGRIIPKGTNIVVHLMALHRNEKHWKDPMRFDPDRFSMEEVKNRHPYSYAPFSAGPRNCIGWKYANMIGTTILGKIVRKYEISSNLKSLEEIKFNSLVLLDVPRDIRITFIPRKY